MSDCLFCKFANKEITPDMVYEDADVLAFKDIAPKAPVHILIIPKKHITSIADAEAADIALLAKIQWVAKQIAKEQGIDESGYRLTTNCRADSGQLVPHLHYHLLGGALLGDIC